MSVKLSNELIAEAKIISKAMNRSVASQIEYWAKIGKIAEENPDLHYEFIKGVLIGLEEAKAGQLTPYQFDNE